MRPNKPLKARGVLAVALGIKMIRILRWISLLPAAIAAWYAVFFIGFRVHRYTERWLCPPEFFVSDSCGDEQTQFWLSVIMHLFVGLSAIAVGVTSVLLAPDNKERVMWVTLAAGLLVASYIGVTAEAWSLLGAAGFAGVLGALVIAWFLRSQSPNCHFQDDAFKATRV